ncbi:hypothetical protein GCM10009798_14890 [Nocardioides panacihumi]|uniref:Uncharacterized protein n=1 Tax=Nocardioides panacihumi TaxID=400774 RepID=A0ABN2QQC8_9ACTN
MSFWQGPAAIGLPSDDDEDTAMTRSLAITAYLVALCSAAALVVGAPVPVVGVADLGVGVALALASVGARRARG